MYVASKQGQIASYLDIGLAYKRFPFDVSNQISTLKALFVPGCPLPISSSYYQLSASDNTVERPKSHYTCWLGFEEHVRHRRVAILLSILWGCW